MTLQSFERALKQPKPSIQTWMLLLLSLVSVLLVSGRLYAAPATVEIFAGSGGTASGPVSSTEAYQYRLNANNPTDNVNTAYTSPVSVSYAITNSVYNVSTYQGGATNQPNLLFGGTFSTKLVSGTPTNTNIIAPSQINVPLNTVGAAPNNVFAATLQNGTTCPATGVCTSTNGGINSTDTASPQNHGTRMSVAIRGFDAAGLSTNNVRHRVGQVTVTFSRPVTNPVLQVAGLGGLSTVGGTTLGFSGEFTLVGNTTSDNNNNIVLRRIAGSTELAVSGNNIVNRATTITATTGSGGASGSVLINGRRITSLIFDVFMRGDNRNTEWTADTDADPELRGIGLETLFFGVSSVEADSDLSIAKTQRIGTSDPFVASQILPNQTDIIQYRISMSNGTANALVAASFSDVVPSNITGLSIVSTTTTGTGATCPNALTGNTLTGTFSGPTTATCTIVLQGTASTVGSITNTATILENATDPNTANNSSSVNAIIAPSADLSVTKTNGVTNVSPAGTTAYTVVVNNAGPSAANNATFQDAAATGLSKTSITCTASGGAVCPTAPIDIAVVEGGSGIAIPTLPSAGSVTFTINANVTASGGNVTNAATVTAPSGVAEINTANNSASDTDTVSIFIDPNGTATDQCSASNAVNVITPTQDARFENATTITNIIPVSATNSAQTYFGTGPDGRLQVVAQLGWSQGNPQASRTSSTLSIEVNGTRYALLTTRPAGEATNSLNGTITAANGATVSINGGAFASSVTIVGGTSGQAGSVLRNVVIRLPTSISAATSLQSVFVGGSGSAADDIAYNYQTINQCKNRVTLIKALVGNRASNTDQFAMTIAGQNGPATTTTTGTGSTVSTGSTTLFKVRGSTAYTLSELMAAGSASTLSTYGTTYTCTNASTGTTTVLPSANTSGQSFVITPQAGDDITCTMTNRLAATDLQITKTNNLVNVTSGGTTAYTIVVTNAGPGPANGALFRDVAVAGLSKTSITCTATSGAVCPTAPISIATVEGATGIAIPTLPSGGVATFVVNASITALSGTVSNTATVTAPAGVTEVDAANNTATDTDTVLTPVVPDTAINEARFTIVPDLPTIFRGGTGTQLVTITNNGPSGATGTIATFIPAPQTGVTVTGVSVVGGSACTFASGEWSCPVGSVANGANFQLNVSYSTAAGAALNTAQQATIKVRSNEFNPGSGVGETLYKVWGTNQTNEERPNGAFWVGYEGTGGSAQVGANTDENTPILNAWPAAQTSPTGAYLTQAALGVQNSVYGASSTTASATIQRIVTNMSTDADRSVQLAQINTTTEAGDNRRAWEYRTGIYLPSSQSLTFCAGNTSLGIDDNAYILVDGVVQGLLDGFAPGGTVTASLSLTQGYHSITYRIINQNTYAGNAETAAGGYGPIGILFGGSCNTAGFDQWANTAVPASINIIDAADLQITKTNSVTAVDAAGTTSYAVVVTNAGPSAANNALFRDVAAAGLSKTSITCTATGGAVCPTAPIALATVEGATGIAIPTLPSAGVVTFTVNANVTALSGSVTNTATVTAPAGTTEIDTANNTASDTDTVTPRANLSITKTNSVSAVDAGSTTAYTVVVSNAGPSAADGALFRDVAATGLNKTSITCTASGGAVCPTAPISVATVEGATGVAIPTLPSGGSVTFTVNATVTAITGSVSNVATVTAPAGVTEIDTANNTATDTDTVTPAVDLSVVKSQRAGTTGVFQTSTVSVLVLDTVQYQLVFTNNGPSSVTAATLSDSVPAQFNSVSVVSATGANGATSCSASNTANNVTGTWGGPTGATCTVLIQATAGLTTGTFTNTATTAVPNGTVETNNANNSSSVQTAIAPAADLAIAKTQRVGTSGAFVSTALTVNQLQTVQYQLVLTNNGPTTANGASYTDTIPANITGLTVVGTPSTTGIGTICATPSFSGQTLSGTFTAAQNGTCTVVVQGTASTTGSITNTATITAVGVTDTVAGNDSSSVDMTIRLAADLSITKTNSIGAVDAGSTTAYSIVVNNAGLSAANNALFRDVAAAGLNKTTITCTATGGAVCPTAPISVATVEGAIGIAIPTLPSGGGVTFTVNANVTATTGSVTNTATVTAPAGVTEIDTANNTASDTDTVTPRADLSITKTNSVTTVSPAGTTAYTVVVSNAGPSAANDALFGDLAATGLSKTSITCAASGGAVCPTAPIDLAVVEGGSGIAIPTLPSGGSVTFTINANVTAATGSVTNTATITVPAGVIEIDTANNSASDTDTVTVVVDPGGVSTDQCLASNAVNVITPTQDARFENATTITNTIPVSAINTAQTYFGTGPDGRLQVVAQLGWSQGNPTSSRTSSTLSIEVNGTRYALMTTRPAGQATGSLNGTITAANGATISINGGAFASSVTIVGGTSGQAGNVLRNVVINLPASISAATSAQAVFVGGSGSAADDIAYNFQTINQCKNRVTLIKALGGNRASNTDQFAMTIAGQNGPATTTTTGTGSTVSTGSTTLFKVRGSTAYTLSELMAAGSASTLTNYATTYTCTNSSTGTTTVLPAVNSAGQSFVLTPQAGDEITCTMTNTQRTDLSISKTNNVTTVNAGSSTAYSIVVSNAGPNAANGGLFRDVAAAGLSKTSITCSATGGAVCPTAPISVATVEGATGIAIPTLPSGGSVTFTVNANVTATSGSVTNTATVTAPAGVIEIDPANNTASDTDTVNGLVNITGRVFTDNSGTTVIAANAYNGIQNVGELGLAGSTVQLNNCAGTVIATTQTDGAGDYAFGVQISSLSSPNFCITQTNLASYRSVSGTAGYVRATDTITVANTGVLSYSGHNFGDAQLSLVLTTDGQQTTTPSGTVSYPHILRSDSVLDVGVLNSLTSENPTLGWTTVLYRDNNCNGTIDTGELALTSAIGQLLPNQEICVVQRVNAPANASNGAQHVATLSASYTATVQDAGVLSGSSNTRTDTTLVGTAGLDMRKQVRVVASCPSTGVDVAAFTERNTAKNGDFLEYEIIYSNRSTRNLSEVKVRDVVPSNTLFKTASCQVTPSGSSCAINSQPAVDGSGEVSWLISGSVAPAATGSVRFCVQVPPLAAPPIQ